MICIKCSKQIPDDSIYCLFCGKKQIAEKGKTKRGNGQGTIYRDGNKWRAIVTLGYYLDEKGNRKRLTRSKRFTTKKEANLNIGNLATAKPSLEKKPISFKELYDKWLPTHKAGKDTINCYKAAIKYFKPVWVMKMEEIGIEDLQECIDDCPHGKRTQQNMKAVCGLVYKFGIPRQYIRENLNLAPFLTVGGNESSHRDSFSDAEIEQIRMSIGVVEHADWIYCMIYLGFRPSEFLALSIESYDAENKAFVGGAKTEAGTNRTVTVSPKIQQYVDAIIGGRTNGPFIPSPTGTYWDYSHFRSDIFYNVLEQIGIDNPVLDNGVHRYTPHSCRHTFATLMKRVEGADKDKLELIGHTSSEMLRYYQDVSIKDLKTITDRI